MFSGRGGGGAFTTIISTGDRLYEPPGKTICVGVCLACPLGGWASPSPGGVVFMSSPSCGFPFCTVELPIYIYTYIQVDGTGRLSCVVLTARQAAILSTHYLGEYQAWSKSSPNSNPLDVSFRAINITI